MFDLKKLTETFGLTFALSFWGYSSLGNAFNGTNDGIHAKEENADADYQNALNPLNPLFAPAAYAPS